VIAKDQEAAERRFEVGDGTTGTVYTRTGRPFFNDTTELVDRLRAAAAPLFESLETDWLALDCELLPWSAKAIELIKSQYASVSAAARHALPEALESLAKATARGLDVTDLAARTRQRLANAVAFRDAYAAYCGPARGLDGITLAPFQILAAEGRALALTESHEWHLAELAKLEDDFITPTRHRFGAGACRGRQLVAGTDRSRRRGRRRQASPPDRQPGAAGPEGPRPGVPAHHLRTRLHTVARHPARPSPGKKRQLARREHGLGLEALTGFVEHAPLWKVHQSVFAVLALESEPVDPRL
jgi:hypothetical protein